MLARNLFGDTHRKGDMHRRCVSPMSRQGDMHRRCVSPLISIVVLLATLTLTHTLTAHADTAAVLAIKHDDRVPAAQRTQAQAAIIQYLTGRGTTVITPEDAKMRMIGKTFQDCAELECAAEVTTTLGSDFTVVTTLWPSQRNPDAASVAITIVNPEGESYGGDGKIVNTPATGTPAAAVQQPSPLDKAVLTALAQAMQRMALGRLAYLNIHSEPTGADVYVDGNQLGHTPYRRLTEPGSREIILEKRGYRTNFSRINLAPLEEKTLDIKLNEGKSELAKYLAAKKLPARYQEPSIVNWIVAGGLVAVAAPLLISAVRTAANDGNCSGDVDPAGNCSKQTHFGGRSIGFLIGGGVALAGAAAFAILQPIKVDVDPVTRRASLNFTTKF